MHKKMEIQLTLVAGAKVVSSVGFAVPSGTLGEANTGFIVSCPVVGDGLPVGDVV